MSKQRNRSNIVFADPTVDFVFKKIFGTKEYSSATIDLINSFIEGINVQSVEFLNTVQDKESKNERTTIVDVLAKDDKGNHFIIEMQNAGHYYFRERMMFYASKVISKLKDLEKADDKNSRKQMDKRKFNYDIKGTYVIAILNFNLDFYEKDDDFDRTIIHYRTTNVDTGKKMPASPEYIFLQLRKSDKLEENVNEFEKKWLTLLRNSKHMQEVPQEFADDPGAAAYFKASLYANLKADEQLEYDRIMDTKYDIEDSLLDAELKGEAKGIAKGIAKGETKKQLEIAKAMKAKGLDVSMIAECTGLGAEEVEKL